MLESVEWGEFQLGDLFEIKSNPQLNKDSFVFSQNAQYPYFTRTVFNNGILGNVEYLDEEHKIQGGCLAVGMIAMQFFYMEKDFYAGQFTKRAVPKKFQLTHRLANYFITVLNKKQTIFQSVLVGKFEQVFKEERVQLPIKNGQLNLDFMEDFVAELEARRSAELEAYLSAAGLKDYTLTAEEQQALAQLECNKTIFSSFSFDNVFDQIKQGRRLKKDDQIAGHIPFVMAGVTNTGVVGYIANPVARFPKNSITLDIFGNAFYRNYNYGAGDDTGVYWNSERNFSKEIMLFLTTSMQKAVEGQFSYGKKLRSSQSLKIKMQLPQKHNSPDYAYMQTLLSAVQKLVIKDVVQYADKKIAATQSVIQQNNQESR
ncbi:restriction endonuclease subunit S [Neisseria weaveri]|uniref:restriction endonuclease subunit S n=1 Tax=Neisseria weaveri TaxID=28091 RepID=UPI000D304492|nr:restriction endonuclease subunit S [Neisseria weaveri]